MKFLDIWTAYIYPLIAILIPIVATIHTLNMRLKNENREKHQPYLILETITDLFHINKNKYYLVLNDELEIKKSNELKLEIFLKNIGYGVATNIKFYDLFNSSQINGCQKLDSNLNQKLFTTFDIASNDDKKVQFVIRYNSDNDNRFRILCVYQDLNHNVYNFIMAVNIKKKNKFDYFSYQPSSLSYQRCIKDNRKIIEKILKEYKNL